jgi:hypothetical protein
MAWTAIRDRFDEGEILINLDNVVFIQTVETDEGPTTEIACLDETRFQTNMSKAQVSYHLESWQ